MSFDAHFTAIDFETANRRQDSACQLAAVRVRHGTIAESRMWMIRPRPFYFSPGNIQIHGISPDDVENESEFGDIWDDIHSFLDGDCIVAHNASFDLGVLHACLQVHRCDVPNQSFTCTRAIARATWPNRQRFGLKPLSDWLGIRFKHHDALEDSVACAKVLLAAGIDRGADDLESLERELGLQRGQSGPWGYTSVSKRRRRRKASPSPQSDGPTRLKEQSSGYQVLPQGHLETGSPVFGSPVFGNQTFDIQRLLIRADFLRRFQGQSVVIAGRLKTLDQELAKELATRLGGTCQDQVDTKTTILIVEGQSVDAIEATQAADDLRKNGAEIRVLSEVDFLGEIVAQN